MRGSVQLGRITRFRASCRVLAAAGRLMLQPVCPIMSTTRLAVIYLLGHLLHARRHHRTCLRARAEEFGVSIARAE